MKESEHYNAYEEHRDAIFGWALEIRGLERSQRIIGIHASRAIVELLSAFLHKKKLVDEGFQLNHRWFKSERVVEKLPEFKNRRDIVRRIVELENSSEMLAYGAPKPTDQIKKVISLFNGVEKEIRAVMDEQV
jgi:hypothetical protein